jgi:hypothetical protein
MSSHINALLERDRAFAATDTRTRASGEEPADEH